MLAWRTAIASALSRRTRHGAVGTKHATIALFGLQPDATPLAVIEELASIGWHEFDRLVSALWTSERRLQFHLRSRSTPSEPQHPRSHQRADHGHERGAKRVPGRDEERRVVGAVRRIERGGKA